MGTVSLWLSKTQSTEFLLSCGSLQYRDRVNAIFSLTAAHTALLLITQYSQNFV